jgi:hypothetical protein
MPLKTKSNQLEILKSPSFWLVPIKMTNSENDKEDGISACRSQGSLPFKKRRLQISTSPVHQTCDQQSSDLRSVQIKSQSSWIDQNRINEEHTIALALVASAASSSTLPGCRQALQSSLQGYRCETPNSVLKRTQQPYLVSPLPNGCHGRTARNKSFCRRLPCYNGSKYCKLHYQQHFVSAKRSPVDMTMQLLPSSSASSLQSVPVLPNIMHQDKRFMGAPNQVRCVATTTRGRPCAYIAVNSTEYCHLHVGHQRNPSPRRKLASCAAAEKKKIENIVGSGESRGFTPTNILFASSLPLLSTLPTGKWLNQLVIISTGHLQNHSGRVERWGNGWVSVRVDSVGLHNRRSFELYVANNDSSSDNSVQGAPGKIFLTLSKHNVASSKVSSTASDEASHSSTNRSFTVSPTPTTVSDDSSMVARLISPQTPSAVKRL